MTDYFLDLVYTMYGGSNICQSMNSNAFKDLVRQWVFSFLYYILIIIRIPPSCLIITAQPSSSECVAMTKYEKVGKDYLAKINTRIICLLDPHRIEQYMKLSDISKFLDK